MLKIHFDAAAKIRRLVYMRAFIVSTPPVDATIVDAQITGNAEFVVRHGRVATATSAAPTRVEIYGVADSEFDFNEIVLHLTVEADREREEFAFDYRALQRQSLQAPYTVMRTWGELVANPEIKKMLDIGGRARSGVSQKGSLSGVDIMVVDIVPAHDVDLVADVHELSSRVDRTFDAFMSIATFEHLLMPWKAAIEINRTLRLGAVGLVITHQTVGIHEMPWDFFRFSDASWTGIFNSFTGFEIIDAGMTLPAMIIPLQWTKSLDGTETAAGYITSGVVVRKTSEATVEWNVPMSKITSGTYPSSPS